MFKVGDRIQFKDGLHKEGEVLLVGDDILLVRVERGGGHDGLVFWTQALGWKRDETCSCWFVRMAEASVVKSKPSFKGNIR